MSESASHTVIADWTEGLLASSPRPAKPDLRHELEMAPREATVMIVDDEIINVEVVKGYLQKEGFQRFITTTRSTEAFEIVRQQRPDLVLLDINMPQVSGIEILEAMRCDNDMMMTPVVILTASTDSDTKLKALRLGASDFLSKPVDPSELISRVKNVLTVKAYQDHLAKYSAKLEQHVRLRTEELVESRQEALNCLARAGEYRDDDTGHHVVRVGRYAALIAKQLGFPAASVELIEHAAQLHDVGKIGIPDAILHKPGKLTDEEFEAIKRHCEIGRRIVDPLSDEEAERLGRPQTAGSQAIGTARSPVLRLAAVIASTHHEKWDGSGYPNGLVGKAIPIEGRIVAVADVFDALSSARPYKDAFPIEKCFQILLDGRASHFDPTVLDAFLNRKQDVLRIRNQYSDVEHRPVNSIPASPAILPDPACVATVGQG